MLLQKPNKQGHLTAPSYRVSSCLREDREIPEARQCTIKLLRTFPRPSDGPTASGQASSTSSPWPTTPNEVYHDRPATNEALRIEVGPDWPSAASCAAPAAAIDGEPGQKVELVVRCHAGRRHLPVIQLKRVA